MSVGALPRYWGKVGHMFSLQNALWHQRVIEGNQERWKFIWHWAQDQLVLATYSRIPLVQGAQERGKVYLLPLQVHRWEGQMQLWLWSCFKSRLLRQDSLVALRTAFKRLKVAVLGLVPLHLIQSFPPPILQEGILMFLQKQSSQMNPGLSCLWTFVRLWPLLLTPPWFCLLPTTSADLPSFPFTKGNRVALLPDGSIYPYNNTFTYHNVILSPTLDQRSLRTDVLSYLITSFHSIKFTHQIFVEWVKET